MNGCTTDGASAARGHAHACRDRGGPARHRIRRELDRRDDQAIACGLQVSDRDCRAGGGWFEPTTPVGFEIADAEPRSFRAVTRTRSATGVGVPHLVGRVVRSLDLAAVVTLVRAAEPGERVRDRLIAGPLAAVGLERAADPRGARDRRLRRVHRPSGGDDPVGFEVAVSWPSSLRRDDLRANPEPGVRLTEAYVFSAAFEMRPQSDASGAARPQRNQRNSYCRGAVPVHVPRVVRRTGRRVCR